MEVTPEAVREGKFREALRGYNRDDVDEFLERVASGIAVLQERLRQATERAVRAEAQATEAAELDESLKRTLVLAQRTADLAIEEARREAEELLRQAHEERAAVAAEVEVERRRLRDELQASVREEVHVLATARASLLEDVQKLEEFARSQRDWLRRELTQQLEALDHEPPTSAVPEINEIPELPESARAPAPADGHSGEGARSQNGASGSPDPAEPTDVGDDVSEADVEQADAELSPSDPGPAEYAFLTELQRSLSGSDSDEPIDLGDDARDGDVEDEGLPPPDERARAFFDEDDDSGVRRFGTLRRRRR